VCREIRLGHHAPEVGRCIHCGRASVDEEGCHDTDEARGAHVKAAIVGRAAHADLEAVEEATDDDFRVTTTDRERRAPARPQELHVLQRDAIR